jgi:DNA-binding protein YbaB
VTDPSAFTNLISETAAALSSAARGAESVVGSGTAADGLISVRAALPGRVVGLDLDPAVLRLPVEELAEELTAAINAALADLQASAGVPSGVVDLDALGGRLREIQQQTTRQFAAYTDSLLDAQTALARRAGDPR